MHLALFITIRLILSSGFFGSVVVDVQAICECNCSEAPVSVCSVHLYCTYSSVYSCLDMCSYCMMDRIPYRVFVFVCLCLFVLCLLLHACRIRKILNM